MRRILSLVALLGLCSLAAAQDAPPQPDPFDVAVKKAFADNTEKFKDNADVFVRAGLLADRKAQTVMITARFTGVTAGDAVEFFLVGPESGKDYESLAVSAAKPSDVHAALEFLGMEPGRPVNYRETRNWPKGERVDATFSWNDQRLHVEEILIDPRTEKALPVEGFMFVGSIQFPPREPGGATAYAADVSESKSILSNYNEPSTVLDVPGQAVQGAVYGFRKINPAVKISSGQPVTVTLKPRPMKDGTPRVVDRFLYAMDEGRTISSLAHAKLFVLDRAQTSADSADVKTTTPVQVLAALGAEAEAGRDVFLTITPNDRMTLDVVRKLYALFDAAQGAKGLRLDAAAPGHLYWRAFFPQEEWRDAKSRLGEPWELHLRAGDTPEATQALLRQFSTDDNQNLKTRDFTVKTPEELAKLLKEESGRWTDGVFVFPPPDFTYGQLMSLLRPGLANMNWWYVFPPTPEAVTQPVQMP